MKLNGLPVWANFDSIAPRSGEGRGLKQALRELWERMSVIAPRSGEGRGLKQTLHALGVQIIRDRSSLRRGARIETPRMLARIKAAFSIAPRSGEGRGLKRSQLWRSGDDE